MRTRGERVEIWGSALLAALGLGCDGKGDAKSCADPAPLVVEGQEVGIELCEGGAWRHRLTATACPSIVPRADYQCGAGGGAPAGECSTDAECGASQFCAGGEFEGGCFCQTGCVTDADCGEGQLCECGSPMGRCVTASCRTAADCEEGLLCSTYITVPGCGGLAYACQSPDDQCASDADCAAGSQCTLEDGARVCGPIECAIGRPFLVLGKPRLAETIARSDWSAGEIMPETEHVDAVSRALLAGYFTEMARMEHASIAAFARFALELLALGAPPDLVLRAQAAMGDETRHARYAFALASAYRGRALGPDELALDGALIGSDDARTVLRRLVREGCVGETIASMEAREALSRVSDRALRFVFGEIARDEAEHALLAWKSAQFLVEKLGEAGRATLREEMEILADELCDGGLARPGQVDEALLALGYVSDAVRAELRREALERTVIPGLRRIVDGRGQPVEDAPSTVAER